MIDGLRAEFPGVTAAITGLRRPIVGREPVFWAFLAAVGAGFIVSAIVGLLLFVGSPLVFRPTEPRPPWLTYANLTQTTAAFAVGAVALRAGGLRALAPYVAWSVLLLIAQLPGRQLSCSRSGGIDPSLLGPCDLPGLMLSRWSTWLALALGAAASRWLIAIGPAGANLTLRAAGVFGLVLTAAGTSYGLVTIATLGFGQLLFDFALTTAYLVAELVAGALAGLILARSRSAAVVLVALLVLSGLASTLPNVRANWIPNMPLQMMFLSYSVAFAPVVGGVGIVVGWIVGRRRPA
ncbi:MAG: hypothetical protein M3R54_01890 [Chloroflexota bacterium]|nr:hypothetical protein [Chloroflexota bacterium]